MSEYTCMDMCTYKHMYLEVHAGSLTCKDSALLHRFFVLRPYNTVTGLLDFGAHKPWLQAPFASFILFSHVICGLSFVNLRMMNCVSLGNKEYFIVIVIIIVIHRSPVNSPYKGPVMQTLMFLWSGSA